MSRVEFYQSSQAKFRAGDRNLALRPCESRIRLRSSGYALEDMCLHASKRESQRASFFSHGILETDFILPTTCVTFGAMRSCPQCGLKTLNSAMICECGFTFDQITDAEPNPTQHKAPPLKAEKELNSLELDKVFKPKRLSIASKFITSGVGGIVLWCIANIVFGGITAPWIVLACGTVFLCIVVGEFWGQLKTIAMAMDMAWILAMRSKQAAFLNKQFSDFESNERTKLKKLDQECNQMERGEVGSGRNLIRKKILQAREDMTLFSAVLNYAAQSEQNNERVLTAGINTSNAAEYVALYYFEIAVLRYYSHFRFEDFSLNDWFAYYDLAASKKEEHLTCCIEEAMDAGGVQVMGILTPKWDNMLNEIKSEVLKLPPREPHPAYDGMEKAFLRTAKKQ